ncbi:MAG: hypothetical protein ACRC2S_17415 [Waterburya sp.]
MHRSLLLGLETIDDYYVIRAEVPLAEMFDIQLNCDRFLVRWLLFRWSLGNIDPLVNIF